MTAPRSVKSLMEGIRSTDRDAQGRAYSAFMELVSTPVEWAYEVWDELLLMLHGGDNRLRSIAAQVLCSLSGSDPEKRMVDDLDALLQVTRDPRFVTARHCMQSLWKVGVAGEEQRKVLLAGLEERFHECSTEKNASLIRYDICEAHRKVFDETADPAVRDQALALIATEPDQKYRSKYSRLWKDA